MRKPGKELMLLVCSSLEMLEQAVKDAVRPGSCLTTQKTVACNGVAVA